MFERRYRRRLEADLARWQASGLITPAAATDIRGALPPLPAGVNVAAVVGIVGGLLIAAAFLAFVAANWVLIGRPLRLAVLIVAIACAFGIGAWFGRTGRSVLSDLAATVGSIIFGATIALVGQMYHLGGDFAGGMLLWALGSLAAAALTGSRGALAVALATGVIWSEAHTLDLTDVPHLPFALFWLLAAGLALAWSSRAANHLVAVAALVWWIMSDMGSDHGSGNDMPAVTAAGAALMLGAGLFLATTRWPAPAGFGRTLAAYGAFSIAGVTAFATITLVDLHPGRAGVPAWAVGCGGVGVLLGFAAAAFARRAGPALASAAAALVLIITVGLTPPPMGGDPWLGYALVLIAMLALVVSGTLDDDRPRTVAGWLGLAGVIAAITWGVQGSLLRRALFLAIAGAGAVIVALLLGRLWPQEKRP